LFSRQYDGCYDGCFDGCYDACYDACYDGCFDGCSDFYYEQAAASSSWASCVPQLLATM
jgi:hypothetical protein